MYIEKYLKIIWGVAILTGVLLGAFVNKYWLILAGFIGVHLIQMAFTDFCLAGKILKALGVKNKEEYYKSKQ